MTHRNSLTDRANALRERLRSVRYERIEDPVIISDAELLVEHGLARLDHKVFTSGRLVACVARSTERGATRTPVQPVTPHKIGTMVTIIRQEHGWHDGMITGVITGPYGVDGYTVFDETTKITYVVGRHRDVRRI